MSSTPDPRETEQLLAMAAHDLRAPLRHLALRLALLLRRDDPQMSAALREELRSAQGEARHLQDLLESILAWVAGSGREPAQSIALDEVVAEVAGVLAERLQTAGATLQVAPNLPQVWARRNSVYRVVLNLLRNAVVHGGPQVVIRVSPESAEGLSGLRIDDNGPGIPEALHARIFQPFERGAAAASTAGTGLGLAICRRLIEDEQGQMGLDRSPDGGATFWFGLPTTAPAAG